MKLSKFATDRSFAGGYANMVLYRLCEEQPSHDDVGIVQAKLELIGRFYSASPKRGVGDGRYPKTSFFEYLARRLKKSNLDAELDEARSLGRVSTRNLHRIQEIHANFCKKVVDFINDDWNVGTSNRKAHNRVSFGSKYLHFHAPMAFFIYDSVVLGKLEKKLPAGASYARCCEGLLEHAEKHWPQSAWTPRSVDQEIYRYETVDAN